MYGLKQAQRESFVSPAGMATLHDAIAPIVGGDFVLREHENQGLTTVVYSCDTPQASFIVRRGNNMNAFQNDAFAARHAGGDNLPVPSVKGIVSLEDSAACVTARAPGVPAQDDLLFRPGHPLNASLQRALTTMHTARIPAEAAAGHSFGTVKYHPATAMYAKAKPEAARRLDNATLEEVASLQKHLSGTCLPQLARLCHNDLKGDNIIAEHDRITGVIDWAMAQLGDPASDLGRLYVSHPAAFDLSEYGAAIGSEPNFRQRALYYAMGACVGSVRFFGSLGDQAEVAKAEDRLIELASEAEKAA